MARLPGTSPRTSPGTSPGTRSPIEGDESAQFTTIDDQGTGPASDLQAGSATYSPALVLADIPVIAATLDGGGSASILVRTTLPDAPPIEIEEPSHFLHSPALAANHTEGAVALYDLISGLDNGLIVRRWSRGDDGDSIVKGTHYVVDVGDGAPPYAPAIAYLADDVWFVAWSEGGNPDYRVRGRFVDFEADED